MGSLIYLRPPLMDPNKRFIKGWVLFFLLPQCFEPLAVTHRAHNTTTGCKIAYEENLNTRYKAAGSREYAWIHFLPTYQLDPPNQFPMELFDEIWYSFELVPPCLDMDIKPSIIKISPFITYIFESHKKNMAELH